MNNDLFALKKVSKTSIDKQKRLDHAKNEKNTLLKLNSNKFVVQLV